jgi:hypothetical protein
MIWFVIGFLSGAVATTFAIWWFSWWTVRSESRERVRQQKEWLARETQARHNSAGHREAGEKSGMPFGRLGETTATCPTR